MELAPPSNMTKVGAIALILVVALAAIWLNNNIASVGKLTAKKATA
jgi:hypothetical protein